MAVEDSWNNGLKGSEYIRVRYSSPNKRTHIYSVRSNGGTARYDLSAYPPLQRKKFVQRAIDGYNEIVDFAPPVIPVVVETPVINTEEEE